MRKSLLIFFAVCFIATNIVCTKSITDKAPNIANNAVVQNDATGTRVTYIIKKGAHYCSPNPLTFTSQSQISFKAVFDSSCIYRTVDPANQNDINKLYGFSDCNTQHLENSARIGWRWSKDSLRIFGFVHNNSQMLYKEITTVKIDSVIKCSIICLDTQYKFKVNGKILLLPRHCSGTYSRYMLYPYFGGDEVAPHEIKIRITQL
jgi:hypothetical protein